ncbi:MAG: PAS domain S-box protein [Spartobacteria bacterium]|nr:PAS domain S-box protein [Spartobacteria bacterium]
MNDHAQTSSRDWFEAIPVILIGVDKDGVITRWTDRTANCMGVTASRALGMPLDQIGVQWNVYTIMRTVEKCVAGGGAQVLSDVFMVDRDGSDHCLFIEITPVVSSETKQIIGALLVVEDVTEEKALRNELAQARVLESIGSLAAGIAHEINTPLQFVYDNLSYIRECIGSLSGLKLWLDQLAAEGDDALKLRIESLRQALDVDFMLAELPEATIQAKDGLNRIAQIVNAMDIFKSADLEEPVLIDVGKAVENALIICQHEWQGVAKIDKAIEENLPEVWGYPASLGQALINIIKNAAQAVAAATLEKSRPGIIRVAVENEGSDVCISIRDNGLGIPEALQDKIFDPFFSTRDVGHGTGQGLYAAYNAVETKNHGHLYFDSVLNEGTTFYISLSLKLPKDGGDNE